MGRHPEAHSEDEHQDQPRKVVRQAVPDGDGEHHSRVEEGATADRCENPDRNGDGKGNQGGGDGQQARDGEALGDNLLDLEVGIAILGPMSPETAPIMKFVYCCQTGTWLVP